MLAQARPLCMRSHGRKFAHKHLSTMSLQNFAETECLCETCDVCEQVVSFTSFLRGSHGMQVHASTSNEYPGLRGCTFKAPLLIQISLSATL